MKSVNKWLCFLCFSVVTLSACSGGGGSVEDLLEKPGSTSGEVSPSITLGKSSLFFGASSSSETVAVTANVDWDFECIESWVTVSKGSSSQLNVSVSANSSSARSSSVFLKEQGKSTTLATISVSQEAASNTPSGSVSGNVYTANGVSFKMIRVEGGTFTMGATAEQGDDASGKEKPAHSVTLSSYSIGETEVTQELWEAVMGSNPSFFKGSNRPVEDVSWDDCQTFVQKLNQVTGRRFRLPTEAEWEYAARGGDKSRGYKYSGSNTIDEVAWYTKTTNDKGTKYVKTKKGNEIGLYDMSGNVMEWCQDWYGSYSSGSQTNPTGPASGPYRVCRGGSWGDSAGSCRSSNRFNNTRSDHYYDLGLRLAQ